TTLNASESGLRALIQRHLRKPAKTNTDRDKIDFLLVQYFALCAPAKIYHKQIELQDTAAVMKPVLGEADSTPLAWCEPLEKMIISLRGFRSLRDMLKNSFIAEGRKVKEAAGGMFYDPSALLSFIRFNFLMRRTLIELMHAALNSIRSGLQQLEEAGAPTIDCRQSGLSASEPLAKITQLANEWKQPFQKDYTERTVNETFDKLLNLRSDVEKALQQTTAKAAPAATARTPAAGAKSAAPAAKVPAKPAKAPEKAPEPETDAGMDFENCLEQIWEQLIATPPTRGRSMTTVKIGR